MRKHMQGLVGLVPLASVEVEAVFRYVCEVDDSEDRRVVRPCVSVVRRRLSEIVESCPYELSYAPWVILVSGKIVVRDVRPPAVLCVV